MLSKNTLAAPWQANRLQRPLSRPSITACRARSGGGARALLQQAETSRRVLTESCHLAPAAPVVPRWGRS
jgi:hypothetical protein